MRVRVHYTTQRMVLCLNTWTHRILIHLSYTIEDSAHVKTRGVSVSFHKQRVCPGVSVKWRFQFCLSMDAYI